MLDARVEDIGTRTSHQDYKEVVDVGGMYFINESRSSYNEHDRLMRCSGASFDMVLVGED